MNIIKKKNIDAQKNEIVLNLKENYEKIQNKLIDPELFNHYLGEKFDNECINIEEIKNIEKMDENEQNDEIENEQNLNNESEQKINNNENIIENKIENKNNNIIESKNN